MQALSERQCRRLLKQAYEAEQLGCQYHREAQRLEKQVAEARRLRALTEPPTGRRALGETESRDA